ncbi:MAG TPA: type II secretion system protein [Catenuloplanes sp.]|jgi:type II secretory pathway pseudopilin PulG
MPAVSPPPDDRGETLLELIVAVMIMSVAMVAVLGGIATSILMSDIHRKQATAGVTVRNYAEAIGNTVAGGGYQSCAATGTYGTPAGFTPPAGYAASVAQVRYWNGSAWQSSCSAATDTGLQQVTAQVTSDAAISVAQCADDHRCVREQVVVVLRKPCGVGDPPCG